MILKKQNLQHRPSPILSALPSPFIFVASVDQKNASAVLTTTTTIDTKNSSGGGSSECCCGGGGGSSGSNSSSGGSGSNPNPNPNPNPEFQHNSYLLYLTLTQCKLCNLKIVPDSD